MNIVRFLGQNQIQFETQTFPPVFLEENQPGFVDLSALDQFIVVQAVENGFADMNQAFVYQK